MNRIVEYVFFFGFMVIVGFLVWQMVAPFISALALSAIIVTICYPLHIRIQRYLPKHNQTLAALLSTIVVLCIVILPLFIITSVLLNEAVSIFKILNTNQIGFEVKLQALEVAIKHVLPSFDLNITEYLKNAASWLAGNLGAIFTGTASTLFSFFIAILGAFYLFRDGHTFTKALVHISPLPDAQDEIILKHLATAVRSVATGAVLIALLQGVFAALGFWLFGFNRAILFGVLAAFGSFIPGAVALVVYIPAIMYLVFFAFVGKAIGLGVWAIISLTLIDNLIGPHIMSRGNNMHPFLILLSVLGGVSVFGPIGFVVGPVLVSLFAVLLELYSMHISDHKKK